MKDPETPGEGSTGASRIRSIRLVKCDSMNVEFGDSSFEVSFRNQIIKIKKDPLNFSLVRLKSQQVPYKATILGGFTISEDETGNTGYRDYFHIDWEDDMSLPDLSLRRTPHAITRIYHKGQWIELGSEEVSRYHVIYRDGVEADFDRKNNNKFNFSFSTGFYGQFEELEDGSYTMTFRGDRLMPGEDDYHSHSKFIVSRSKHTGKLLLFLQDNAIVHIS